MQRTLKCGIMIMSCWALLVPTPARAQTQTLDIPGDGPPTHLLRSLAAAFQARYPGTRVEVPDSIGAAGALPLERK